MNNFKCLLFIKISKSNILVENFLHLTDYQL